MTKTEVARLAILSVSEDRDRVRPSHLTIMEICRTLKLSTDEAVSLRATVVTDWLLEENEERRDLLHLAKTVINQYARDYSLR
jgi:hypothetical protein